MKNLFFALIFLSSGCATFPPFQAKNSDGIGYEVKDIFGTTVFQVNAILPESASGSYADAYASRVVGETCLTRGFQFFDTSSVEQNKFGNDRILASIDGYCFKEDSRKGLGILFKKARDNQFEASVEIEDTTNKANTLLKTNDLLIQIQDTKIQNVAEIKRMVYKESLAKNVLAMTIIRDRKKIEVKEPINSMVGFHLGPDNLTKLRKIVRQ